jgi:hypothetical protein
MALDITMWLTLAERMDEMSREMRDLTERVQAIERLVAVDEDAAGDVRHRVEGNAA